MLTQIRERATGWIAWVIVILITIPFALWGIQSYFENAAEIPVAVVNGEEIPVYEYQNELSRQRQALSRQLGGNFDPALLESTGMRTQVIESMISTRLINQYVSDQKYRLSDEQLKQRIESNPSFLRDGLFSPDQYRNLLSSNGFSPQSYEATERQNAAIEQFASAVADTSFVTEEELNQLLTLQAQTRKTNYVILSARRFESEIEIDEVEARQYYDDNLAEFEDPARIKVDYIELSVDSLASTIEPSDEEIRDTYEQISGRYKQAETRKVSHILFSVKSSAGEDENNEILEAAESVLAQAQAGVDFAELAKQYSTDPGSKERGGDLGIVARGQMVKSFEDAVYDMDVNEIRGPIKTQFGYHIIKLTELTQERQKTFQEVQQDIAEETSRVQAENLFAERGEAFQNLVFEDPESLTAAADELELEVRQSDWFSENSGEGLAEEVKVRRAAFSEDVLNDDLNSAAIELGFDRMVAIRKADYEAAHPKSFDEVRGDIEQILKLNKSRQKTKEQGEQLVAGLSTQTDWNDLLQQQQLESETLAEHRNQVPGNLAELGDSVFAQASPEPGSTIYSGISMGNGDYIIYALKEVNPGDLESIGESQRDGLRQQLLARDGRSYYRQFQDSIRQSADVSIDQEQLQNPASAFQ